MATWQAVDVNTGAVELPKYDIGDCTQIYIASIGSTAASGDIVPAMTIPAGVFMKDVWVDVDKLDSAVSPAVTFEIGYIVNGTTTAAGIIASGNTIAQNGGIVHANVAGLVGYSPAAPMVIQGKFTNSAGTAAAGKMRIGASYTANP